MPTGRDTMGVTLMDVSGDNAIVAVARGEAGDDDDEGEDGVEPVTDGDGVEATGGIETASDEAVEGQSVTVETESDDETES